MISAPLLFVLALLSATAPFATDMYLPVMPQIADEFGATQPQVQLTLTGFFVGMAMGQLLIGPVSDIVGRRRLLLAGAVVALGASAVAAMAPGIGTLVAARIFQGLGGGACAVLARSVVPDLLSGEAAARAFSLLMAIGALAPAVAPILGGLLAQPIGWRGIYWVLVGLHALQLVLAYWLLPETGGGVARTGSLVRTVAGNYARVLRTPVLWGFILTVAFAFAALFSYISASSFVVQSVYGFSPRVYSLLFALNALGIFATTVVNGRLVGRVGPATMLRAGTVLMVCGGAGAAVATALHAGPAVVLPLVMLATAPVGVIMGNSTALATGYMRPYAGSISAVMGCVQSLLGGAVSPLMGFGSYPPATMGLGIFCSGALAAVAAFWSVRALARATP
ncbi:multidrug effflux MFS transporter [Corynebacterium lizhenjunii]|uniref:Multidrug effflux MFS transporter n=1 Tax=Corynebacterium lizhenjunii TaxID=2709394 RepID=A0A7T0PBU2_9CORY|nr:multidrug effflux MFS transporter [Corynebacterium lizhenjunii]QPK78932.1 multidrug effflux MFS transporter [Corynebacterium lizhenjunii]